MAISAKRFKFLDQETNIPIEKFEAIIDSWIRNQGFGSIEDITGVLDQLMKTIENGGDQLKEAIKQFGPVKALSDLTRETKGLFDKVMAVAGLADDVLDKFIGSLGGDYQTTKTMKSLIKSCRTVSAGQGNVGKPFTTSTVCKSGNRRAVKPGCGAEEFSEALASSTNGTFRNTVQTPNKDLRKLITMSGTAYNLGLCGAYSAVGKDMDNQVKAKGAAGLLSMMNASHNSMAIMDLAGSSTGLNPKSFYPGVVEDFLSGFEFPFDFKEKDLSGLADRVFGSSELLDSDWNVSNFDGSLSLKSINNFTDNLGSVFESVRGGYSFAKDQLNDIATGVEDFMAGAYEIANEVENVFESFSDFGDKLSDWF